MQRAELGEPGVPACKRATPSPGMAPGSKLVKEHSQDKGFEDTVSLPRCPLDATSSEEFCFLGRWGRSPLWCPLHCPLPC